MTVGQDKTVKLWDTRSFSCLQTFVEREQLRPENRFSAMFLDVYNERLLVCSNQLHGMDLYVPVDQGEYFSLSLSRSLSLYIHPLPMAIHNPLSHFVLLVTLITLLITM